jgi:hypothetical protein
MKKMKSEQAILPNPCLEEEEEEEEFVVVCWLKVRRRLGSVGSFCPLAMDTVKT